MKTKKILLSAVLLTFILFLSGCGKKEYTVEFDSNDGTIIENQKVEKNSTATKPNNPIKEGYTFEYWELDGVEYDFDTKVTKDITLTAKYQETSGKTYTVSFNTDGGSTLSKLTIKENQKIKDLITPVKKGYKFLHWELDGKKYDMESSVSKDITLTAKWEKEEDSKPVNATTKKTTTKKPTTTAENTSKPTTTKPTTTTKKPVTYSVEWVKVDSSSIGQYTLYIRSSEGKRVSGKVEVTVADVKTTYDIPATGRVLVKSTIDNAVFKGLN